MGRQELGTLHSYFLRGGETSHSVNLRRVPQGNTLSLSMSSVSSIPLFFLHFHFKLKVPLSLVTPQGPSKTPLSYLQKESWPPSPGQDLQTLHSSGGSALLSWAYCSKRIKMWALVPQVEGKMGALCPLWSHWQQGIRSADLQVAYEKIYPTLSLCFSERVLYLNYVGQDFPTTRTQDFIP